jgi:hypothetical protein
MNYWIEALYFLKIHDSRSHCQMWLINEQMFIQPLSIILFH